MNRQQHKTRIQQAIKVVAGGPADVTRGVNLIGVLNGIVDDFAQKSELITPEPYQRLNVEALRQIQTQAAFGTGRSYELVRPGAGNVLVEAIGDTGRELSPLALWRNPATPGQVEPVRYDLANDETTPTATGGTGGGDVTKAYVDAADAAIRAELLTVENDLTDLENEALRLDNDKADKADIRLLTAVAGAYLIPAGIGTPTRYATAQQAHEAAANGDAIRLEGVHESLYIAKNLTITGGLIRSELLFSGVGQKTRIIGVTLSGRIVNVHSGVAAGNDIRITNCPLTETAFFEQYALGINSAAIDSIVVSGCRVRNTAATGSGGVQGIGVLRLQERSDSQQRSRWEFADCDLESANGPFVTGYCHPETRVVLSGRTTLKYAGAAQTLTYTNGGGPTDAQVLIDQRTAGGLTANVHGMKTASGSRVERLLIPAPIFLQKVILDENAQGLTFQVALKQNGVYAGFPERTTIEEAQADIPAASDTAQYEAGVVVLFKTVPVVAANNSSVTVLYNG